MNLKLKLLACTARIKEGYKTQISLTVVCYVLSLFTLVAYHIPLLTVVAQNVDGALNWVLLFGGIMVLLLVLNFMFYYLLLYLGRIVGKCILALLFVGNAISLYFINTYKVLIDEGMMGNVFNTQYSEASSYFSLSAVLYVLFLGILPCVYLFTRRFDYGSIKRFFVTIAVSLGMILLIVVGNMRNVLWIDHNATQIGSLLMPWSYTVNSVRYWIHQWERNRPEIPLPDAEFITDTKDVVVLVIGESARAQNFSLYGYSRKTNPLLEQDSVVALRARAAATSTIEGVRAIVSHKASDELYETLPNYMWRNGVDVVWRSCNWGEPRVRIDKYYNLETLKNKYPNANSEYDGLLLAGLKEEIQACDSTKMLVVLHTSTSHGPTYYKKYPTQFEEFTPVCRTVEVSKASHTELINAYDNTILYTDYLLHSVIDILRDIPNRRCCMIYVSDHGESLGEDNLYMHGVPLKLAPDEQINIPFVVWTSDKTQSVKSDSGVGQYHVYHSVMDFLGMTSSFYDESKSVFE